MIYEPYKMPSIAPTNFNTQNSCQTLTNTGKETKYVIQYAVKEMFVYLDGFLLAIMLLYLLPHTQTPSRQSNIWHPPSNSHISFCIQHTVFGFSR